MDDHRYYGVDVKVQKAPEIEGMRDKLTDSELEAVWDGCAEDFWRTLEADAQMQIGVEQVEAEGRSGGWAVPYPHIDPEEESTRFKEFENLCDLALAHFLETVWPEAVKEAIANKEAAFAARQSHYQVTLTWDLGTVGDKPILTPPWLERIFTAALEANGLQNFELEVKEAS